MCEEEEYFIGKMEDQYYANQMSEQPRSRTMQPQLHDQDRDMTPEHEIHEPPTEQSQALQRVECQTIVDTQQPREVTPQQARDNSIAGVLNSAYAKASTLQLTPEEAARLSADFPDEDIRTGARGDDRLIYLEHAAVRRRLLEVFGPGQWTIINRRSWLDESAGWLYADIVLVCRGCFVGECIGAARYTAKNSRTNYSDAIKGAESDALGRIAGTALGVGLQLWSKGFAEGWHQRNRTGGRVCQNAPQQQTTQAPRPAPKTAPQTNVERPAATTASVLPGKATEKTREWAIQQITATFDAQAIEALFFQWGWLEAGKEGLTGWKLEHVPTSKQSLSALADEIRKAAPEPTSEPSAADAVGTDDLPSDWADVVFSIPPKGCKRQDWMANPKTIGQMYRGDAEDKRRLFAFAKNWQPEPWVGNDGKKRPPSQEDSDCRIALDLFLDWRSQRGDTDE